MELENVFSLLLCFVLLTPSLSEEWTHHTVLDGNGKYHLRWKPPQDKKAHSEIIFQVEVEATGYVGFGLSPNGGMAGSDIVTGWVKDGRVHFQDRYGIGNTVPPMDQHQDWKLLDAKENDTHTVLKFSRFLDTCDEEDVVIDDSTMRIIYAFSDRDPMYDNPMYHFQNRGSKSLMLLQANAIRQPRLDYSSLLHWDLTSTDYDFSNYTTVYWCKIFKTPPLTKKHHIVHVKPLIQEGHEEFVHHMVLYECVGGKDDEFGYLLDFVGHACYHPNMPDAMRKCEGVLLAWAVGGDDIIFPEHVGLPLDPLPGKYYMLEVHYDNPSLRQGIKDNSGLRIFYTPNIREYDAGCLMLGSTVTPRMIIPPGQKEYEVSGHTNTECLGSQMPKGGIRALGVMLHSHLLGRKLKARHFRGNVELPPLAEEKNYDFNYQEYRYFKEEVEILPEDQITVECIYDSTGKVTATFGGISTDEEMCLAFVMYYPRIDRYASLSVPTYSSINKVLHTNLTHVRDIYSLLRFNWTLVNMKKIQHEFKYSEHTSHCYFGNGKKDAIKSLVSYPRNLLYHVLPESSACENEVGRHPLKFPFIG